MYVTVLGRQSELSIAELERVFGSDSVFVFSSTMALVDSNDFDIERLGGTQKAGLVIEELPTADWSIIERAVIKLFNSSHLPMGKITFGLSVYGLKIPAKTIEKTGLKIKSSLKKNGRSARHIVSRETSLSSATSHHNKLGLAENKIEIIIAKGISGNTIIASSIGSQNISAYAKRDQGRPKRDAFVGMLPPKLAQIMINLAVGEMKSLRILDPFCGTGVVLQEAALLGHIPYGSDLSEKMVDYSTQNLEWLIKIKHLKLKLNITKADATNHLWKKPIDAIVTESYLGQPFSAPPSEAKLKEVVANCNHIISSFLKNIGGQIQPGTNLCVAIPAWRDKSGALTHLPLTSQLAKLGYKRIELKNVDSSKLAYFREDQIVARELLLITKT